MVTRTRTGNGNLAAAMTLLVQTQAQFVSDMAEMRKDFAAIRQDLDTIKTIVIRHETMLEKLAEAIRDRIGFKQ